MKRERSEREREVLRWQAIEGASSGAFLPSLFLSLQNQAVESTTPLLQLQRQFLRSAGCDATDGATATVDGVGFPARAPLAKNSSAARILNGK